MVVILKSWDWVRPLPPSLGQSPNFYLKFVLNAPLILKTKLTISNIIYSNVFFVPSMQIMNIWLNDERVSSLIFEVAPCNFTRGVLPRGPVTAFWVWPILLPSFAVALVASPCPSLVFYVFGATAVSPMAPFHRAAAYSFFIWNSYEEQTIDIATHPSRPKKFWTENITQRKKKHFLKSSFHQFSWQFKAKKNGLEN